MGSFSSATPRHGLPHPRVHAGLVIVALMLLLAPAGIAASSTGPSEVQRATTAQESIQVMAPRVEEPNWNVTSGVRHFVFNCADGYPGDGASLQDFFADCELLYVYTCLEQRPWSLMPVNPGCEDPRRR